MCIRECINCDPGLFPDSLSFVNEVIFVPSFLLFVFKVRLRHMFWQGCVSITPAVSSMDRYALHIIDKHLHYLLIINNSNFLSNVLMRHTVLVPVFSKDNMVIWFDLCFGEGLKHKWLTRQLPEQMFFFTCKLFSTAYT